MSLSEQNLQEFAHKLEREYPRYVCEHQDLINTILENHKDIYKYFSVSSFIDNLQAWLRKKEDVEQKLNGFIDCCQKRRNNIYIYTGDLI